MNNTIKIEFECPEFDSELEINIVIRKDGKETVVDSTVSSPNPNKTIMTENKNITEVQPKAKTTKKKKEVIEKSEDKSSSLTGVSGNFMDLEF